jgi:1-acyl-sn-glycerol-3-phosphate acyltransferase
VDASQQLPARVGPFPWQPFLAVANGRSLVFYEASWLAVTPFLRVAFKAKFDGKQHIPKKGPAILASNHLSFLDHFIMPLATRRQVFYISKAQHFDSPIRSFLFRRWGVIPLRRGEGDQEAFQRSVEILREGNLFCIYP